MASKYGAALTGQDWRGWPLRFGRFPEHGRLEALVADHDALLVWTGGRSEVTLRGPGGELRFVRHGGSMDVLPRGTALPRVQWQGARTECISVAFDDGALRQPLGSAALSPGALRVGVGDPHVVDLVLRLEQEASAGQPLGALYVEGISLALASYAYATYCAGAPRRVQTLSPRQARRVVEYIEGNLDQNIGIAELARLVDYSPDHFARLFKRSFGRSPYRYVLERRVERAKLLLRDRSIPVVEVALRCGYSSQSHLSSAFKSQTGATPGQFRRS